MGLVFWIDENKMAGTLVEKAFKAKGMPFYILDNLNDFAYLIEDLKPSVMVIDQMTLQKSFPNFERQYQSSEALQKTPIILITSSGESIDIPGVIGHISKPLDPFQIPDFIYTITTRKS